MKILSQLKTLFDLIKKRSLVHGILTSINATIIAIQARLRYYPGGYSYPYIRQIQLEPTKYCNMACPMCLNPYMPDNEKGDMNFDDFKKIIDQFPYLTTVRLQGLGESFLNPDLFKMISYLKQKGMTVGFADNGSLLKKETVKKVLNLKVNYIALSLDTLNSEKYKEIRGVDLFTKVQKNIEFLVAERNKNPKYKETRLIINMVVNYENFHELLDMIEYAKKLGFEEVIVSTPQSKYSKDQQNYIKGTSNSIQNDQSFREMENLVIKKAIQYGITLNFNRLDPIYAYKCLWNFNTTYITWDGYLTPCCHYDNPKIYNFGNILKQPFKKVWNNRKYRDYRMHHFDPKGVCKHCPHILY